MRDRARHLEARRVGVRAALMLLLGAVAMAAWLPERAAASCCVCRNCSGAPFCVEQISSLSGCAALCNGAGCPSGVYEGADDCAGGCDGAPEAPTATPSGSAMATPTLTPTHGPTDTATSGPSPTPSGSATATPSLTPTHGPTDTATSGPSPTPSKTPTIGPTGTPTHTPSLGGRIAYYVGDRPVPDAVAALLGDNPDSRMTDANGRFGFSGVGGGMESLRPSKQGGRDNGVTSLDASHVLQLVAGLRTFNGDQRLACDVTGNGAVTALDATRILQFQAALLDRFKVAELCNSDWIFRPVPGPAQNQSLVPPMVNNDICQQGRINYSPLVPPALAQDFIAILFGDCTGNWNEQP